MSLAWPLHLVGDDGEPVAGLARPRRLDGGVQRQQIRLVRDVVDHLDDLVDLVDPTLQIVHVARHVA